ncbi:MAG TPA: sulfatase-like hydrolase/transferase [Clostridiales bacterium]|jgi:phosphoglycerol transferase MdoB-like AlkP superfamily enzyme|nr:sulfatase-like hydrolase/transferase [Clostridiales bacterium]
MKTIKKIIISPYFVAALFAIKMMVYYALIDADKMKHILIFISMAVCGVIFTFFARSRLKYKRGIFLIVYTLLSLLMFADTMYYNYYHQTVSIRQLWQARAVTAVPDSFIATLIPASFILFVDIPFTYSYFNKYAQRFDVNKPVIHMKLKLSVYLIIMTILIMIINPFGSLAIARVNSFEFFTSHVGDIYETITDNLSKNEMDEEEILEVIEEHIQEPQVPKYNQIGKGKNLVVIQMEAIQDFVINSRYNGQEITPNINRLIEKDTIYYDQYFSNIGKGNTADAEFSSLNSLYPLIDGEIYRLYEDNTFYGLPWLMREQGYRAFAVHGFEGDFWNREAAYPYQGFEDYISMEDLDQDEIIGMGISDKSMFRQLVKLLKDQVTPFFSFVITLTNHHPYILDEEFHSIELLDEDADTRFGDYLQTVRYTDEAIGQFIDDLKAAGLYDNTVIALYGDHHGLNCGMEDIKESVSRFIGREYDYDEMLNVPLLIHIPNSDVCETIHTTGGQIDFLPTIANIMGLTPDNNLMLGQDLTNASEGFVAFTTYLFEGSFANNEVIFQISREEIFEESRAWRIGTNEEVDIMQYKEEYEKALLLKKTSKEILDQNLMHKILNNEIINEEYYDE